MAQLVFVDLETTGLDVDRHGIIEIGCIFETDGQREAEDFHALANPGEVEKSAEADEVHKIPPASIAAAAPLEEVLRQFDKRCQDEAIISGWNTKFDEAFLYRAYQRYGIPWRFDYHIFDVWSLYKRFQLLGVLPADHGRVVARRSGGEGPSVWLFVGVNGTGKTTTIGKLARREADGGARVVLAAGDTFRAAASDQLAMWAERSSAHIVRGAAGADPASVVYDAVESAAARGADLVLADTAGRFHTEQNLMAELQKVRRVAGRGSGVVTETLLVLDATTGQNGLAQARQFTEAVDVTGVVLTKLDGSAKGGIVVSVQTKLGVPVKLVGVGEGIADLVPFDESEFVDALFA